MADLTIVIDVRKLANGEYQTMSSYRVPKSEKVVFVNAAKNHGDLVITPKDDGVDPPGTLPFCESDKKTPVEDPLNPIPPEDSRTVHICKDFTGDEFLYTAQIGETNAEDPIVIIERTMNYSLDPLAALFLGAGIGAAIVYLIVKSRANKMRPQQG